MDWRREVSEADFEERVLAASHSRPVLVDIGADWCGPCRVLAPRLERLAHEYAGAFLLANVDADENMRLAGRHKVRGFPTVVAYSRGAEVARFHSAQTDGFLRRFIDDVLRRHAAAPAATEAPAAAVSQAAPAGAAARSVK
ncbi:MAG TPA: thioredoxin domain-containing protein [Candidatus Desulfobacillus sp.]|nr:thioredoxin domain-containing protein [Candidatus Desulfobacillus sp.]